MKKVPSTVVKKRSRELTSVFEAFTPYNGMEGRVERIWITEIATDRVHLVGHTKGYVQVLVVAPESMLGTSAMVRITSVGRWSVFGEVLETVQLTYNHTAQSKGMSSENECGPCTNTCGACVSSGEPECCACGPESCGQTTPQENVISLNRSEDRNSRNLIGWLLRKRKNHVQKKEIENASKSTYKQELGRWGIVDRVLLGGMLVSFLTIIALLVHLGFRTATN